MKNGNKARASCNALRMPAWSASGSLFESPTAGTAKGKRVHVLDVDFARYENFEDFGATAIEKPSPCLGQAESVKGWNDSRQDTPDDHVAKS